MKNRNTFIGESKLDWMIDIFRLHSNDDVGQGRIKYVLNKKSKYLLKNVIDEIKNKGNMKTSDIVNKISGSYHEYFTYLRRSKISLCILEEFIYLWSEITGKDSSFLKKKFIENSTILTHGAGDNYKSVKCPIKLTTELCKIVGAVIADGNLSLYDSSYKGVKGTGYRIVVRDGYQDNLMLLSEWIKKVFAIKVQVKRHKKQNLWYIAIKNKIIFRYLNKIFEIPHGKKSSIVKIPKIIKLSNFKYQKAFVTGAAMFDGGFNFKNGYFFYTSKSYQLVSDIFNVFKESGIEPDFISSRPHKTTGVYQLTIRKRKKLGKLLSFFERKSCKWKQLNAHVNGLEFSGNLNDICFQLDLLFPRIRQTFTHSDVIKLVNKHKFVTISEVSRKLRKNKTSVSETLNSLDAWNILISEKKGIYKYWSINPELKRKQE